MVTGCPSTPSPGFASATAIRIGRTSRTRSSRSMARPRSAPSRSSRPGSMPARGGGRCGTRIWGRPPARWRSARCRRARKRRRRCSPAGRPGTGRETRAGSPRAALAGLSGPGRSLVPRPWWAAVLPPFAGRGGPLGFTGPDSRVARARASSAAPASLSVANTWTSSWPCVPIRPQLRTSRTVPNRSRSTMRL
jgi:hypothetical protein